MWIIAVLYLHLDERTTKEQPERLEGNNGKQIWLTGTWLADSGRMGQNGGLNTLYISLCVGHLVNAQMASG